MGYLEGKEQPCFQSEGIRVIADEWQGKNVFLSVVKGVYVNLFF